jgi:hypothetical protein
MQSDREEFASLRRPKVDRAVLDFVKGHVFDPADFVTRSDGVCRLNPEMARMVVTRVLTSTPTGRSRCQAIHLGLHLWLRHSLTICN